MLLGTGGKMGPTLARMARRALPPPRRVIAVSRYSSIAARHSLESHGVETIACDLLDPRQVNLLPDVANIIFMVGQKFGTSDTPELTWMINGIVPALVAQRYPQARMVIFSTGCVYPLVPIDSRGSLESDTLAPPGEYAFSCVARERVFTHYSKQHGNPMLIYRLNYAIDLRYGVLHDIASKVWQELPVDISMGRVNVIWQGDANARALQCLPLASTPLSALNITGADCLSVRNLAARFAELLGKPLRFVGQESAFAWLSNATKSFELLGPTSVSLEEMIQATAEWVRHGGHSLGKPTHFEATDGKF